MLFRERERERDKEGIHSDLHMLPLRATHANLTRLSWVFKIWSHLFELFECFEQTELESKVATRNMQLSAGQEMAQEAREMDRER